MSVDLTEFLHFRTTITITDKLLLNNNVNSVNSNSSNNKDSNEKLMIMAIKKMKATIIKMVNMTLKKILTLSRLPHHQIVVLNQHQQRETPNLLLVLLHLRRKT